MSAVGAIAALSLVAAACGDDDDTTASTDTAAAVATDAATAATTGAGAAATKDIVDTAVGAGSFTVLAEALTTAGLVDTLKGAGPFTVFAPTDDAFTAALTALGTTKEALFADKEKLATILKYHVVSGKVMAAEVTTMNGKDVATVAGPPIKVTVNGSTVMINDATISSVDVAASNGVIHVIDKVLLPPS